MERRFSIIASILLLINVICALALLASDVSILISPSLIWQLALLGLAFPYLAFVNLIFVFYWLLRKRWYVLISLIPLIAGYTSFSNTVQFKFPDKEISLDSNDVRIMSFNVRIFDLYNWSQNQETRKEIYSMIQEERPDILCIQEFFSSPSRKMNNTDSMLAMLSARNGGKKYYYNAELTEMLHEDDFFGAATFSVYPIIGKGKIIFDTKSHNICTWTDIVIKEDTLRVFNIHLQSIRFADEDYRFIEKLVVETKKKEMEGSMKILRRLKRAFIKRAGQTDLVADKIRNSPYPVLVCGDFNDPPSSYTYWKISKNLHDTFLEKGWGFAKTYIGVFPSFRIDYIFHDDYFETRAYSTIKKKLSDHYPIKAILKKSKKDSS